MSEATATLDTLPKARRHTRWWLLLAVAAILLIPAIVVTLLLHRTPTERLPIPFAHTADGVPIKLGSLGGAGGIAYDVNGTGEVVGAAGTADGQWHAFLSHDGVMTDLGTMGMYGSTATAVNEAGQVVGFTSANGATEKAFLWSRGTMVELGGFGGMVTEATDINASGQVVGYSQGATEVFVGADTPGQGGPVGFLWENGRMIRLETADAYLGRAEAINDAGQILGVGFVRWSSGGHALLWEDGRITDLGAGRGIDLNNRGQAIVALNDPVTGGTRGTYLWEGGRLTSINEAEFGTPSAGLNDHGVVAGFDRTTPSRQSAATWQAGKVTTLPFPRGISQAFSVGPTGIVVGFRQ